MFQNNVRQISLKQIKHPGQIGLGALFQEQLDFNLFYAS